MTSMTRNQLFECITQSSFAIDDVKLYLDTHPCDKEAMEYYQKYRQVREEAMKDYRDCYGPISAYDVAEANEWTWINSPWPWEGEC